MSTAIKVENLSKMYQLGEIGTGTISRDLERWFTTKILRKEDPFLKIGETNDRTVKGSSQFVYSLKDVNFDINQGDAVGIIGRNGAGKSTLLKVLSQVTSPTTGNIKVKGRIASLLEVGTGFHPELTGRENIYLNGAILGMRKAEIKRKFDEIVDFSEVERYIDTPVKRYSSGMYVRLAFAVAAHLESEILIVDEVLAVGDAEFQKKCLGKMGEVSQGQGRTVLFVSHNLGSVQKLCNKGILLNKGQVEADGDIDSVVNQYIANTQNLDGMYLAEASENNKKNNYFTKIYSADSEGNVSRDFLFDESINLHFEFVMNEMNLNTILGIGIQDKLQSRVTTVVYPFNDFSKVNHNTYKGSIKFQEAVLAPNNYSFVFVLWVKGQTIYDNVENICSIRIHDNGTELAVFEGFDYGSVILKTEIKQW